MKIRHLLYLLIIFNSGCILTLEPRCYEGVVSISGGIFEAEAANLRIERTWIYPTWRIVEIPKYFYLRNPGGPEFPPEKIMTWVCVNVKLHMVNHPKIEKNDPVILRLVTFLNEFGTFQKVGDKISLTIIEEDNKYTNWILELDNSFSNLEQRYREFQYRSWCTIL